MANLERIRKVVEYIEQEVAYNANFKFDMTTWYAEFEDGKVVAGASSMFDGDDGFCGTAMCFAGAAAVVSGAKLVKVERNWRDQPRIVIQIPGQEWAEDFESYARNYLDLSYDEASALFYAEDVHNTDDLRHNINAVLGEDVFAVERL